MPIWKQALLIALLLLTGCPRQVRDHFEAHDYRPMLLLPEQAPAPDQVAQLFEHTLALHKQMPLQLRNWTADQQQHLPQLQQEITCVLQRDPGAFAQALLPYQRIGRLPLTYERIVVPLESDLDQLTLRTNQELALAYHVLGALVVAERIQTLLPDLQRLDSGHTHGLRTSAAAWSAQAIATVSWLNVLLQAEQAAGGDHSRLSQRLADLEREIQQYQQIMRQRLATEPRQARLISGDIALLGDLLESTRRARAQLDFAAPQIPQQLLQADQRLQQTLVQPRQSCP